MYKPAAKRRWGYYALPVLHDDRLVAKVDATADRNASVLRVHAIHEDVRFTRTMTKAVEAELDDLASWLGLRAAEPLGPLVDRGQPWSGDCKGRALAQTRVPTQRASDGGSDGLLRLLGGESHSDERG